MNPVASACRYRYTYINILSKNCLHSAAAFYKYEGTTAENLPHKRLVCKLDENIDPTERLKGPGMF